MVAFILPATSSAPTANHLLSRQTNWTVGQSVATTSGRVQGHAAKKASTVSEYLGIPFGQAPVGSLRFQPPVRYNGTGNINGTNFGFQCIQNFDLFVGPQTPKRKLHITLSGIAVFLEWIVGLPPQGEDCLTLNIWTKPQVGDTKKAVLIFLYGGDYVLGASAAELYNGQVLADTQDVIVVTLNYRMNLFGFPGYPQSSANVGILDQRLAVEWIRDNIAAFGGDPDRMVLFGQSAGAGSTDIHSYAFADDPIVSGFILESSLDELRDGSSDTSGTAWFQTAELAGCYEQGTTDAQVLACMQTKSPAELVKASGSIPFGPVVDGKIVLTDYASRTPAALPVLLGSNNNEPGIFKAIDPTLSDADAAQLELQFTCAAAHRAAWGVQHGNPTWRYRWFGDFPNTQLTVDPPSGAWHGSEVPILFGTAPQTVFVSTPAEIAIGTYLQGAWAAFAKDPMNGLASYGVGWPQYNANETTLIRLAYQNQTGINLATGNAYDAECATIPSLLNTR